MSIGLIGCGFIGMKHIASLLKVKHASITALCDTSNASLERATQKVMELRPDHPPLEQYTDFRKLLDQKQIDTVVIAVHSGLHGQIAKEALIQGKHVIVEKPMALSLQEAREMIRLSNAFGGKLAVCHQKRFYPHLQQLKQYLDEGALGQILFATVKLFYHRNDQYYEQASWRGTWKMDGGVLLNQAIHNMDLILWLLGEPYQVHGMIQRNKRRIEAEDTAVSMLRMKSGAWVQLQATVCASPEATYESIEIVGTEGAIRLSGKWMETVEWWKVKGKEPLKIKSVDAYQLMYEQFHEAISSGQEPLVHGQEGIRALEWIMGIYHSATKGMSVLFPITEYSTLDIRGNEPYEE